MEQTHPFEPQPRTVPAAASQPPEWALKVAAVYQDTLTRQWAMRVCGRTMHLVGPESVQSTWWKIKFLGHPLIFSEAVKEAVQADVIIVSVYAGEEIPLELTKWVDAWLPRRRLDGGALMALTGLPESVGARVSRVAEYLRTVAGKARLDFLPREREHSSRGILPPSGGSPIPKKTRAPRRKVRAVADEVFPPCPYAASLC